MKTIEEIKKLLTEVKYPGTNKNIVGLDMVQNIQIDENKISLRIVFQRSNDPFIPAIRNKTENILKEFCGFKEVDIDAVYMQELEKPLSLEKVKHIIAISSGKGGVGKSTISSNLAIALAKSGYKVGLVDADIFGPSIPKMFDSETAQPFTEEVGGQELIKPIEKYGVKLLSIGFFVDPSSATVWRGPMASNALKQMIEQGYWDELDFLLIDLPPGTSDIHLTLVQTVALDGAIVVSTPQQVALADAVKGINMFESPEIGVPVLGIVENMSWFTPEELPDNKYYLFGKEGAKALAESKGIKLLGQIPIIQSIMEGGDKGIPAALQEGTPMSDAFKNLAENLVKSIDENPRKTKRVKINKK